MTRDPLTLIGVPYELGVEDPGVGFDCWTLVRFARRECFGLATPIVEPPNHLIAATMRAIEQSRELTIWQTVAPPGTPGDVVGMSISVRGALHHVGVVVPGGVLHAWSGFTGHGPGSVVLTPWERLQFQFKQVEVFRCRT